MFATILKEFRQQWQIDALFVADAALYSQENLQQMNSLRWLSRVPATLVAAQMLLENMSDEAFDNSTVVGYRIAECCNDYGGVKQRWLMVESAARKEADQKATRKTFGEATFNSSISTAFVMPTGRAPVLLMP